MSYVLEFHSNFYWVIKMPLPKENTQRSPKSGALAGALISRAGNRLLGKPLQSTLGWELLHDSHSALANFPWSHHGSGSRGRDPEHRCPSGDFGHITSTQERKQPRKGRQGNLAEFHWDRWTFSPKLFHSPTWTCWILRCRKEWLLKIHWAVPW